MLKALFVVTRALFRILCSGVSVSVFGLWVKFAETMLQLVVLVVAVTVGPGCEQLVRFVILIVEFSCMPGGFCVFLLFIWACPLWLVRLVVLVAIVITSIVVLWKSLMFRSICYDWLP